MKTGAYENPKHVVEHPAKAVVVIGTFIRKGQKEYVGGRKRGDEFEQLEKRSDEYIAFWENKLDMLKLNLACHKHYKAGIDYDLVIIDNSTDDEEANKFLAECGVQVFSRENSGFSFGAYKYAWDLFKDKYDYYYFCEQDIVPCKDNWLQEMLIKFVADRNIGAVGNVVEVRDKPHLEKWWAFPSVDLGEYGKQDYFNHCNLDGMGMFTSSRILQEVDTLGGLLVYPMKIVGDYESWDMTPGLNELFYQHPILDMGYTLDSFDDKEHLHTHGIQYVNFRYKGKPLAPTIHAQTLYCNDVMKKHFSWYEDKHRFEVEIFPNNV